MKNKVFFIILFTSIFLGCATLQYNGMRGYLVAKNEIAAMAEDYEISYQNASDVAKEKWKKDIDPLFMEAEELFLEWEYLLNLNKDTNTMQKKYILIRKAILKYLVEIKEG